MGEPAGAEWGLPEEAATLYEAGRRAYEQGITAAEPDIATVAWNLAVERLERAIDLYRKLADETDRATDTLEGLASALLLCGLASGRLGHSGVAVECLQEAAELVAAAPRDALAPPRRGVFARWRRRRLS